MKTTKTFIKKVVNTVITSIINLDSNKLQCARDLFWAKNAINWKYSDYGSWHKFIATLPLSAGSVCRYTTAIMFINKYHYTNSQCLTIIKAIGWHNFISGLLDIKRRMAIKTFIATYSVQGNNPYKKSKANKRHYAFTLPKAEADLLDLHLINYGMHLCDKKRSRLRDAMVQLINKKLK